MRSPKIDLTDKRVCDASIRREDGTVERIDIFRFAVERFVLGYYIAQFADEPMVAK